MAVIKKTQHGTRFAIVSDEDMKAIMEYEAANAPRAVKAPDADKVAAKDAKAREAELAQRKPVPPVAPASTKASEPRANPISAQEFPYAKAEN